MFKIKLNFTLLLISSFAFLYIECKNIEKLPFKFNNINITNNVLGLDPKDNTMAIEIQDDNWLITGSGKRYEINKAEGSTSATGTPGNLMYKNYVGFYRIPDAKPRLLGSARRIDYCLGPCVKTASPKKPKRG